MELAPYNTSCQVLQMFLYYSTKHTVVGVILPRHPLNLYVELSFWFLQWDSCAQTKYPLVHYPPSKNPP